jgi:hypothetical protein
MILIKDEKHLLKITVEIFQKRIFLLLLRFNSFFFNFQKSSKIQKPNLKLLYIYTDRHKKRLTLNFIKKTTIPPPPGGTAILPEYIHYYG